MKDTIQSFTIYHHHEVLISFYFFLTTPSKTTGGRLAFRLVQNRRPKSEMFGTLSFIIRKTWPGRLDLSFITALEGGIKPLFRTLINATKF